MKKILIVTFLTAVIAIGAMAMGKTDPANCIDKCFAFRCAIIDRPDLPPVRCLVYEYRGKNCIARWERFKNMTYALCGGYICMDRDSCTEIGS